MMHAAASTMANPAHDSKEDTSGALGRADSMSDEFIMKFAARKYRYLYEVFCSLSFIDCCYRR